MAACPPSHRRVASRRDVAWEKESQMTEGANRSRNWAKSQSSAAARSGGEPAVAFRLQHASAGKLRTAHMRRRKGRSGGREGAAGGRQRAQRIRVRDRVRLDLCLPALPHILAASSAAFAAFAAFAHVAHFANRGRLASTSIPGASWPRRDGLTQPCQAPAKPPCWAMRVEMSANADEVRYLESLSLPKPTTGPCECRSCRSGEGVRASHAYLLWRAAKTCLAQPPQSEDSGGQEGMAGCPGVDGWYPASNRPRWLSAYPSLAADRTVVHVLAVLAILAILVGGEGQVVLQP